MTKLIIAEMRKDWVSPYNKMGHKIPVVINSNHREYTVGTRLDYGFVQCALRDGFDVHLVQPKETP